MRRIATHLRQLGITVQVLATGSREPNEVMEQGMAFQPHLVHAFHAFRAGTIALQIAQRLAVPLVVTITGTDLHEDFNHPERGELTKQVLQQAAGIAVFSPAIKQELGERLPSVTQRVRVIPQGVWFPPQESWEVRSVCQIPPDAPVLLLPANIRGIKRPHLALEGALLLQQRGWEVFFLLVGAVLEPDEGQRILSAMQQTPWARYLGIVAMERMVSVYQAATMVLNTSLHEGGMANALLEAMWLERPVVAARVPGNTSLIVDEETGLLFDTAEELAHQVLRLLTNPYLCQRLVRNAKQWVEQHCNPIQEAQQYRQLYEESLSRTV